jgi:hypothetical protein
MEHTPEQRDIIRRIAETNKQIDEASRALNTRHTIAAEALTVAAQAVRAAMDRSVEIHRLCLQHGELFRAYLDTLL